MFNRNDFRKSKKKKRRKSSINDTAPNSKTIGFLSKHTRFDEDEISEWYKVFQGDATKISGFQDIFMNIYRADTLVRFAAGSPENGLFCQNGPFFGLFLPPKVLFHTWNMHV